MRKCVLSLEFIYLMIMTFAGTWFGIGVFYTMLYQLFMALFNGSTLLQNVSAWLVAVVVGSAGGRAAGWAGWGAADPKPPMLSCLRLGARPRSHPDPNRCCHRLYPPTKTYQPCRLGPSCP